MTSLTAIFGSAPDKPGGDEGESEKLLNLYWNRAELKKEFAELRSEKIRLQQRINEQQGAAARSLQQLEQLESLLLDPAKVYSTVTYFQLRAINARCTAKLAKFAELLKQQREQRIHSRLVDEWNQLRQQKVAEIRERLGQQRIAAQMLEDRLQAERHRLATMSGFLKLLRGRSVTASLDQLANNIHTAQEKENVLLQELADIEKQVPPDTQGLDVATKRTINYMIIAYAQKLYLLLRKFDIADLAKEAGEKSAGTITYGDKEACEKILERVRSSMEIVKETRDIASEVQSRAQLIADRARFDDEDDAVPAASTVAAVYETADDGTVQEISVNVLADDYWGLSRIVSR